MLLFHGWVIYFFHSVACTAEQAALRAALRALAPRPRAPLGIPRFTPGSGHLPPITHPPEGAPASPRAPSSTV